MWDKCYLKLEHTGLGRVFLTIESRQAGSKQTKHQHSKKPTDYHKQWLKAELGLKLNDGPSKLE